jgi:hypothetical protein
MHYILGHRAHLIKPFLCFDTSALALTFVPATREVIDVESSDQDEYTYQHLQRDVHSLAMVFWGVREERSAHIGRGFWLERRLLPEGVVGPCSKAGSYW